MEEADGKPLLGPVLRSTVEEETYPGVDVVLLQKSSVEVEEAEAMLDATPVGEEVVRAPADDVLL